MLKSLYYTGGSSRATLREVLKGVERKPTRPLTFPKETLNEAVRGDTRGAIEWLVQKNPKSLPLIQLFMWKSFSTALHKLGTRAIERGYEAFVKHLHDAHKEMFNHWGDDAAFIAYTLIRHSGGKRKAKPLGIYTNAHDPRVLREAVHILRSLGVRDPVGSAARVIGRGIMETASPYQMSPWAAATDQEIVDEIKNRFRITVPVVNYPSSEELTEVDVPLVNPNLKYYESRIRRWEVFPIPENKVGDFYREYLNTLLQEGNFTEAAVPLTEDFKEIYNLPDFYFNQGVFPVKGNVRKLFETLYLAPRAASIGASTMAAHHALLFTSTGAEEELMEYLEGLLGRSLGFLHAGLGGFYNCLYSVIEVALAVNPERVYDIVTDYAVRKGPARFRKTLDNGSWAFHSLYNPPLKSLKARHLPLMSHLAEGDERLTANTLARYVTNPKAEFPKECVVEWVGGMPINNRIFEGVGAAKKMVWDHYGIEDNAATRDLLRALPGETLLRDAVEIIREL